MKNIKSNLLQIQKELLGYNPTIDEIQEQFNIGPITRAVLDAKMNKLMEDNKTKMDNINVTDTVVDKKKTIKPTCTSKAGRCICGERFEVYFLDGHLRGIEMINAKPIKRFLFHTGKLELTYKCHTCGYYLKRIE